MKRILLFFFIALGAAPFLRADDLPPPVVSHGFEAFGKDGTLAGLDVWLAGSVRESDDRFQDEAAEKMNFALQAMGRYLGYETLSVLPLTPSTRRVYVAVKFEKGVGWVSFDCYRPFKEWLICRMAFNANPAIILPPSMLAPPTR